VTNLVLPLAAVGAFIVVLLFACGLCLAAHAGDLLLRNPWEEYDRDVAEQSRRQRARQH
jgi:hypothetical protein